MEGKGTLMKWIMRVCKVDDLNEVIREISRDPNQVINETIPYRYRPFGNRLRDMILDEVMLLIKDES